MNAVSNTVPTIDAVLSSVEARAAAKSSGRWLIYGINMAPELTGIGKYTGEMAARLAARGHDVTVVTAYPYYPHWKLDPARPNWRWSTELWKGVRIIRCPIWVPNQPTAKTRILHLLSFTLSSAPAVLYAALRHRPETLFVVEPTSLAAPAGLLAARLAGAEAWLHVQDLELGAALNVGLIGHGRTARLAASLYRWTLSRFDRVTTLSNRMRKALSSFGRDERCIAIFPNWIQVEKYKAVDSSDLRAELGLALDAFIVLYSGAMGEKQGVESLLDVARLLENERRVRFILCGAGPARSRIEARHQEHHNVMLLDPQPEARFIQLLTMADCHVLPQKHGVTHFVMPSKLGPILATGKPVVAQAEEDCEVATAVGRHQVVPPEDTHSMAKAIRRLLYQSREADAGSNCSVQANVYPQSSAPSN
ncbi:MAG TPA: WcaI family glycosyltransferase [Geminicoccus sp.]|jgi:colanic acid biosynthesis glycosyl transferase WcaI|uniref:WcaI family glycosyltransferase n=1 Tax=Geminicoccus sp. TaxID=2024832 RepID=UPI002E2EB008|nr:WcaI family glycosyltransferase [Geminicoccus sp.]HEX2525143.1 WcaI family glycosyltransferase [Geminicoccus sp.]